MTDGESTNRMRTSVRIPLLVGLVAVAFAGALVVRSLSQVEWDPTLYTSFGREATVTRNYGEERLGPVYLRTMQGHDGKFFFVQANDPLILHPEENAIVLDHPIYRSQRMFYPLLAGGGGLFPPEVIVWAMIVVNVIAMGLGTFATARIALDMGIAAWWGLAFGLNFGLISEMNIDGAGVVAAALAMCALAVLLKGRRWSAIFLLVLAALSRETMLIAAAGSAWWLWRFRGERRTAWATLTIPTAVVGVWALYLRLRIIPSGPPTSNVDALGLPFVGFFRALSSWIGDPMDLVVGITMMLGLIVFARRVVIGRRLVGWAFLGFVPLATLLSEAVWHSYYDITRAIAPLLTAFVLVVVAGDEEPDPETGLRRERERNSRATPGDT
jgi:hypothetical protein